MRRCSRQRARSHLAVLDKSPRLRPDNRMVGQSQPLALDKVTRGSFDVCNNHDPALVIQRAAFQAILPISHFMTHQFNFGRQRLSLAVWAVRCRSPALPQPPSSPRFELLYASRRLAPELSLDSVLTAPRPVCKSPWTLMVSLLCGRSGLPTAIPERFSSLLPPPSFAAGLRTADFPPRGAGRAGTPLSCLGDAA